MDFLNRYGGSFPTELLSANGLIGILDAYVFESVDQVSLFLEATMDRMCGNEQNTEFPELFTSFVELL